VTVLTDETDETGDVTDGDVFLGEDEGCVTTTGTTTVGAGVCGTIGVCTTTTGVVVFTGVGVGVTT